MKFEIITKIKGTDLGLSRYKLDAVPCKCLTKEDKEIDFCLLVKTNYPIKEIEKYFRKRIDLKDIDKIEESEYALPYDIRLATTNAREVRMCFSPTKIESKDGKFFILNGPTFFLKDGDRKGKDCRFLKKDKHEREVDEYYDKSKDEITYILINSK